MAYRAVHIDQNPLDHFLQASDEGPFLRVSDVMLRENQDPKEIFAHLIRAATGSKWSHSAIIYLLNDPEKGFNNTFVVEAKTKGINIVSWRNEVVPFEQFTVGIKRPNVEWYVETPREQIRHDPYDPEDTHAIGYLRHVRGIALDQINGLYDKKTVYELSALYVKRVAEHRLAALPQVAEAADALAEFFKKWDEKETDKTQVLRLICSGLVQYSFFEALRIRIANNFDIPEHHKAALSNLRNMGCVLFCADPHDLVPQYIHDVESGRIDIHNPVPDDLMDLLKTAVPADFNNSPNLEWRYLIDKGVVWRIETANEDYQPGSKEEEEVLKMLGSEHRSSGPHE
jgi:hypothetical protein